MQNTRTSHEKPPKTITVTGSSMEPVISDGQRYPLEPPIEIKTGDIVVAHHPYQKIAIIKKITRLTSMHAYLSSVNPQDGTDSDHFGPISRKQIIGKIKL